MCVAFEQAGVTAKTNGTPLAMMAISFETKQTKKFDRKIYFYKYLDAHMQKLVCTAIAHHLCVTVDI